MSALRRAWPALVLLAAAVWPLREAVFAGRVLYYRDIHLAWHPTAEGFVRAVTRGLWPLWDPSPAFGQPLLADPNTMAAYPFTWLNLVLPAWWYYTVFAVVHLWWTALGTYLLCRRWRCSPPAAAAAAALWALSGPALSLVSLYHHFASASWMPWVFLTAERALLTGRLSHAVVWALAMAAQVTAGSADMTAITWLALAAYTSARLVRWRRPLARRHRRLAATSALALSLALALSAVQWLPSLELVTRSARRDLPADTRTYWSLHPLGLAEAWLPAVWRQLWGLRSDLHAALFEAREPFLDSIYVGIATLPLAASALLARRRRARLLAVLAAGALLVALGRHFVAYPAVTALLPPLRVLRYPVKTMVLFAWAWALVCGLGLEAWRRARPPRTRAFRLGAVAPAVAAAAVGLWLAGWMLGRPASAAVVLLEPGADASVMAVRGRWLLAAGALGLAAAALAEAWRRRPHAAGLAAAAGLLAVGDVALFGSRLIPAAPPELYARPPVVDLLRRLGAERLHTYGYTFPPGSRDLADARLPRIARRPEGWDLPAAVALAQQMHLMPATPGRWGLDTGFEPDARGLHPRAIAEMALVQAKVEGTPLQARLLRAGGVTHVLATHEIAGLRLVAAQPGLLDAPLLVHEVPTPLPRAYAVGSARVSAPDLAVAALLQADFDPTAQVVLEEPAGAPAGAPGSAGRVRIVDRRPDRVVLGAEMDREGYVVLLESYDPGWRVAVDGTPARLLRANAAFRAVRVPAGRHVIEMAYRPWAVLAGAGLALAGAIGAAAVAAYGRRRTGQRPPSAAMSAHWT